MNNKITISLIVLAFIGLISGCSSTGDPREAATCGSIQEPFIFWLWHSSAPDPDPNRVIPYRFVEPISFMTSDHRKLAGYKDSAHTDSGKRIKAKGYVLIALGNAMLADQVIGQFDLLATAGFDVYIYDYRGYGNSEGKRRLKAILADYDEITKSLNPRYNKKVIYGMSLGVVVIAHLIGAGDDYDAAVLDSGPSRLSPYGCPKSYDPVANLPKDASKILVITGDKDTVLKEDMTGPLRELAKRRGASIIKSPIFAHPFRDSSYAIHRQRLELIKQFILSKTGG